MPELTDDERFEFDLEKAKSLLDEAGYEDTDGDGVREMPGGGQPLRFRYAVRSESPPSQPKAEFLTGWLKEIGIATTQKVYDDGQLTEVIGKGDYDLFVWGWTPFVDPDPMLVLLHVRPGRSDPDDPTNYYNDANFCDQEYDKLYEQQKVELDPGRSAWTSCTRCSPAWASSGVYNALYTYPDLQAYRTDKFEGFVRQPAEHRPGAVLQLLAELLEPQAGVGEHRRPRPAATAVTVAASAAPASPASSCSPSRSAPGARGCCRAAGRADERE